MKFLTFLVALAFFTSTNVSAQNPGSISGKIISKTSKETIGYSVIKITDENEIVASAATKEDGSFEIKNLALKPLTLEISFIGFNNLKKTFTLTPENQNVNFGIIELETNEKSIETVSIVKERSTIEQKADRKVINVGKDLISTGGTASEIMNNIPTVSVDPQSREISLRGNTNVKVFVDGKPTNIDATQLLQQIPSASIKQIELITNPSAKYNPEGNSGIINIILNKSAKDGFNGSINSGFTQGITPKTNQSVNLNYRINKVNLYTNYGFNHGRNANVGYIISGRPNEENIQNFNFANINTSHLFKLGADYYINDKNTLSVFTNFNYFVGNGNSDVKIDYFDPIRTDLNQLVRGKGSNNTLTFDLNYKHNFEKKGETIEFQVNNSKTKNNDTQNQTYNGVSGINGLSTNTYYTQFNIDYVNPISEKQNLEIGYESRLQSGDTFLTDKQSNYDGIVPFDFVRNIHSVYTNYSQSFGKWRAQVGFRAEQFNLDANFARYQTSTTTSLNVNEAKSIAQNIFTIYPSAYLTYSLNDKDVFNFSFSRRVDRPSLGQLNPVREWTTPLTESRGNPSLLPQFTNSFELNYTKTISLGTITSAVFYRAINDNIGRTISQDTQNPNRSILSFGNFSDNSVFGMELSGNLKLTKFWNITPSFEFYNRDISGTVSDLSTNQQINKTINVSVFNTRLNNNFTVTKRLRVNLFGMYRGEDVNLQFQQGSMARIDLGATLNVLNNKGSITARMNDMFNLMYARFGGNIPYAQNGQFRWESQSFNLTFNYNFGGGKNKELQRKNRDKNETQGGGMF